MGSHAGPTTRRNIGAKFDEHGTAPLEPFANTKAVVRKSSNTSHRRATVWATLAAISGLRRSLRLSPIDVRDTAPTGRGILPSWSCEFRFSSRAYSIRC
jgi:hypothetical protein